jgi:hypothetical protein
MSSKSGSTTMPVICFVKIDSAPAQKAHGSLYLCYDRWQIRGKVAMT